MKLLLTQKNLFRFLGILLLCFLSIEIANGNDKDREKALRAASEGTYVTSSLDFQAFPATLTQAVDVTKQHNLIRAAVRCPKVEWSDELSKYAQEWAEYLAASDCKLHHRPLRGQYAQRYGENLYATSNPQNPMYEAVNAWYDERDKYHGGALTPSDLHVVGHYTQMVWRSTKRIGIGMAKCRDWYIVVCNYDPPGNIFDERPY